jgi:hypothetical protein
MSDNDGSQRPGLYRPVRRNAPDATFDESGQRWVTIEPAPLDREEAETNLATNPMQAAALRIMCHLESDPMDVVAAKCGVSVQALSACIARMRERLGLRRTRKKRITH